MSSYTDQVAAAAAALKRGEDANWELARLTYENTITGRGAHSQAGKVTMAQWCADIREASDRKFSEKTGQDYKAIWLRFGPRALADRPSWTEAMVEISPSSAREAVREREAAKHLREAPPEVKRETFRRLAEDPDVGPVVDDWATEHVAADPKLTTDVVRRRQDDAGMVRAPEPASPVRDYDRMVDQGINLISVALAARNSGVWTPNARTEALLHFLGRQLIDQDAPTGNWDPLFAEIEAYANEEATK